MEKECKVSYRLQPPYGDWLREKAADANMSAHQYARLSLVREAESTVQHQVKDQMLKLRAEVGLLRSETKTLISLLKEELGAEG